MSFIADLHIHGKYSQGTSNALDIENLEKYARLKGVDVLGTGDFTHPKWIEEIKQNLKEDDSGLLKTKTGYPFMLQTEISLIYSQGGKGRRVHNVVLAPDLDTVSQITEYLLTKGRVDYDGRPIFKIPCPEFVESLLKINKDIEVIPAHIWTPWFSMFGSKSGFDTVDECFGDQTKNIHAMETGLSSDPPMNWRLSQLDRFNLVSFSDLHSFWPWRIGRESTIFDCALTYKDILKAIRTGEGLTGTVEVDPNYGKYHFSGHRKCNICMGPKESAEHNYICPVCKREMTIGVLNRIEELADREEGYTPDNPKKFYSLIPLSEIISMVKGKAIATKGVWEEYYNIIKAGKNEFDVLMNTGLEELKKFTDEKTAQTIIDFRDGKIRISPGYDGEYGKPIVEGVSDGKKADENRTKPEINEKVKEKAPKFIQKQKGLNDFF